MQQRHLYGKPGCPSHDAIIAARDHIMEKHPKLVVIGALHLPRSVLEKFYHQNTRRLILKDPAPR